MRKTAESIVSEGCDNEEIRNILKSTAQRQLEYGLSKLPTEIISTALLRALMSSSFIELDEKGEGVVVVMRTWKGKKSPKAVSSFKSLITDSLPADNIINIEVEQKAGGINPDNRAHRGYLVHLCRLVMNRVQNLVNASIEVDPEIKSKKKMVQEIYAESLMHLALLRDIKPCEEDDNVQQIKQLLINGKRIIHEFL